MKVTLFQLFLLIAIERSASKTLGRKVPILSNSSDHQNANINCLNCRKDVKDTEGFITPVFNASTYFSELVYGWTIEVPKHHDILLTISWLNEEHNETNTCENCKPYFEIIYEYSPHEATFQIDKFYNIRQLTNLTVPSHQTEIRFFSGAQCNASQKSENTGFAISYKAVPLEQTWSIYTLLSVFIPISVLILGFAYFCVTLKRKDENQEMISQPIQIYVDMVDSPGGKFKKSQFKKQEKTAHGLRLRSHHSSRLEEPKHITVISSLVETEASESSLRPEDLVTPDSSNPVPAAPNPFIKKRPPPKVNLLNRFPRSASSTPRYSSLQNEDNHDDRLNKSDIVLFDKRKVSREEMGKKVFNFDVLTAKEDLVTQTEFDTSVFLHSSSASSDDLPTESARELSFVSPKKN